MRPRFGCLLFRSSQKNTSATCTLKRVSPVFRSCTGLTNPEHGAKAQSTAAKALDAILASVRSTRCKTHLQPRKEIGAQWLQSNQEGRGGQADRGKNKLCWRAARVPAGGRTGRQSVPHSPAEGHVRPGSASRPSSRASFAGEHTL